MKYLPCSIEVMGFIAVSFPVAYHTARPNCHVRKWSIFAGLIPSHFPRSVLPSHLANSEVDSLYLNSDGSRCIDWDSIGDTFGNVFLLNVTSAVGLRSVGIIASTAFQGSDKFIWSGIHDVAVDIYSFVVYRASPYISFIIIQNIAPTALISWGIGSL